MPYHTSSKMGGLNWERGRVHVKTVGSDEGSLGEKLSDVERFGAEALKRGNSVQGDDDRSRDGSSEHRSLEARVPSMSLSVGVSKDV